MIFHQMYKFAQSSLGSAVTQHMGMLAALSNLSEQRLTGPVRSATEIRQGCHLAHSSFHPSPFPSVSKIFHLQHLPDSCLILPPTSCTPLLAKDVILYNLPPPHLTMPPPPIPYHSTLPSSSCPLLALDAAAVYVVAPI